jgi:hypothetical protein
MKGPVQIRYMSAMRRHFDGRPWWRRYCHSEPNPICWVELENVTELVLLKLPLPTRAARVWGLLHDRTRPRAAVEIRLV